MQTPQLEPEVGQPRAKPQMRSRSIWVGLGVMFGLIALGYGIARLIDWIARACF